MGFLKDLVGGAVKGVKTLVANAKVGREAKAAGFLQPQIVQQQQAQQSAAVAKSNNVLLIIGASILALVVIIISIFKRK